MQKVTYAKEKSFIKPKLTALGGYYDQEVFNL